MLVYDNTKTRDIGSKRRGDGVSGVRERVMGSTDRVKGSGLEAVWTQWK